MTHIIHIIRTIVEMKLPEWRCCLSDPKFESLPKELHRQAVLLMGFWVTIHMTQIGDEIM
jgi:hypothetical protein